MSTPVPVPNTPQLLSAAAPLREAAVPLPLADVLIQDHFWTPRLQVNREQGIDIQYGHLQDVGALDALDFSHPQPPLPIPVINNNQVTPVMWWDSDIAKWIEAASYSLETHPDPRLENLVDDAVARLAKAQQADGYLNSYFTGREPDKRWTNERDWHELYCAGHLIEAAVAHVQATGKRTLLEVVERYVALIAQVYGPGPGQKRGYPGHEEIELALMKLYRISTNPEHLALAEYFVNERGQQPAYFDLEAVARGDNPASFAFGSNEYAQAHKPVREQNEVVGHAVRAMYLYAGMADLAAELGDTDLLAACERLWDDLTTKRLYITGGLGPSKDNEGFTFDYDLPNDTAYAETCAAIALVFWAQRMLAITGDGRYADEMERSLYNNVLAGVSLDGRKYFYDNVLESRGDNHRWDWHPCPCCPPNLLRLLTSFGAYVYSRTESQLWVNLYVAGEAQVQLAGQDVRLKVQTEYPWDGEITLTTELAQPATFILKLRIPGWSQGAALTVDGQAVDTQNDQGYVTLTREWKSGTEIRLSLPMPVQRVWAHPAVRADAGLVALQRGPVVYCLEETDVHQHLHQVVLPDTSEVTAHFEPSLLEGVTVLTAQGRYDLPSENMALYSSTPPGAETISVTAVPYYAWDNREPGEMRVWLRRS
ncbi:glycoside hydrolase family 127 protein [Deinococcus altitudinis]|uniref:glycoside hydrolase family 127 protein n=1 Tax=Deinococcus altitudinis TaxID=468914 RepID=UPI003891F5E2